MLNKETIDFHLSNIKQNNRYLAHKKDLENEITSLRAVAFLFSDKPLGIEKGIEANLLEQKLKEAEFVRLGLPVNG
jgi:hypothetical protein